MGLRMELIPTYRRLFHDCIALSFFFLGYAVKRQMVDTEMSSMGIDKIPLAKAPFFARESYLPFCGVDHAV